MFPADRGQDYAPRGTFYIDCIHRTDLPDLAVGPERDRTRVFAIVLRIERRGDTRPALPAS